MITTQAKPGCGQSEKPENRDVFQRLESETLIRKCATPAQGVNPRQGLRISRRIDDGRSRRANTTLPAPTKAILPIDDRDYEVCSVATYVQHAEYLTEDLDQALG